MIDNSTLEISFTNNIQDNFPLTESLNKFLEDYKGTANNSKISIVFGVLDNKLLKTLKSEFNRYYSSSPNYVWVKERIITALDKLIKLLIEFNESGY